MFSHCHFGLTWYTRTSNDLNGPLLHHPRLNPSIIMIFYSPILSLLLLQLSSTTARTFTVVNLCQYTIWHVPAHFHCLLRRVPRRSDQSLTAMQACGGWYPPAYIHPPPCPKCSLRSTPTSPSDKIYRSSQQGVFSNIFSSQSSTHLSIYIYLDGCTPLTPPLSFQFQITGNLAVYGFAFPLQLLHRRCLASFLPD